MSFFVEHFYQVIEVSSISLMVEPLFKIALERTLKVRLHLVTQIWLSYRKLQIIIIVIPLLELFDVLLRGEDILHDALLVLGYFHFTWNLVLVYFYGHH